MHPLEITYELYLKAISDGVTPNPSNTGKIDDRCGRRANCGNCPLDYPDESVCLIDLFDNVEELFDSYYQRALKNNPEYLL